MIFVPALFNLLWNLNFNDSRALSIFCLHCVVHGKTGTAWYHHLFYVDARRYVWMSDPQRHQTSHAHNTHGTAITAQRPLATYSTQQTRSHRRHNKLHSQSTTFLIGRNPYQKLYRRSAPVCSRLLVSKFLLSTAASRKHVWQTPRVFWNSQGFMSLRYCNLGGWDDPLAHFDGQWFLGMIASVAARRLDQVASSAP